ncbi:hypothetical protein CORC01_08790, partial [Colletotrichum orchidophilum]
CHSSESLPWPAWPAWQALNRINHQSTSTPGQGTTLTWISKTHRLASAHSLIRLVPISHGSDMELPRSLRLVTFTCSALSLLSCAPSCRRLHRRRRPRHFVPLGHFGRHYGYRIGIHCTHSHSHLPHRQETHLDATASLICAFPLRWAAWTGLFGHAVVHFQACHPNPPTINSARPQVSLTLTQPSGNHTLKRYIGRWTHW